MFNIELLTTDREQYPAMPYGNLGQESPAAALNEIARDSFIALERTTQVQYTHSSAVDAPPTTQLSSSVKNNMTATLLITW